MHRLSFDHDAFAGPRTFARRMMEGGALPLRPLYDQVMTYQHDHPVMESILFREGRWQVELIVGTPHSSSPRHRHLRCASADLLLSGTVSGRVEGRTFAPPRGDLLSQLKTIGKGEWHGGSSGELGLIYLSFQMWDGQPTFISQDWEAWPTT